MKPCRSFAAALTTSASWLSANGKPGSNPPSCKSPATMACSAMRRGSSIFRWLVSLRDFCRSAEGCRDRGAYIVRGANRFAVAYVYFASGSSHARFLISKDEARTIAVTIAKLPEL
jgi:hypothetical protein